MANLTNMRGAGNGTGLMNKKKKTVTNPNQVAAADLVKNSVGSPATPGTYTPYGERAAEVNEFTRTREGTAWPKPPTAKPDPTATPSTYTPYGERAAEVASGARTAEGTKATPDQPPPAGDTNPFATSEQTRQDIVDKMRELKPELMRAQAAQNMLAARRAAAASAGAGNSLLGAAAGAQMRQAQLAGQQGVQNQLTRAGQMEAGAMGDLATVQQAAGQNVAEMQRTAAMDESIEAPGAGAGKNLESLQQTEGGGWKLGDTEVTPQDFDSAINAGARSSSKMAKFSNGKSVRLRMLESRFLPDDVKKEIAGFIADTKQKSNRLPSSDEILDYLIDTRKMGPRVEEFTNMRYDKDKFKAQGKDGKATTLQYDLTNV